MKNTSRFFRPTLLAVLLIFWAISLHNITVIPTVYEDEPWLASNGWKIVQTGLMGSDVFAGYYGMESHYYGHMPVYPYWLALIFHLFGIGLFQSRLAVIILALVGLVLTYSLSKRIASPGVGLLAVMLLLSARTLGTTPSQITGILWMDMARISRYDLGVPVLGLAALHSYFMGLKAPERRVWFFLAGLSAAISSLIHVYGIFWIGILLALAIWQRLSWRVWFIISLAASLPLLVYLIYAYQFPADWAAQTARYAPRFGLLSPSWYLTNIFTEPQRYGPGLENFSYGYLWRPGFWLMLFWVPISYATLFWQVKLFGQKSLQCLLLASVSFPLLFGLLINNKMANYLVAFYPLSAVVVAWGVRYWWLKLPQFAIRVTMILALCLVIVEGGGRVVRLHQSAQKTTPHVEFMQQVRSHVPTHARVLGLHNYWFGFTDLSYRSWAVPIMLAGSDGFSTLTLVQALDQVAPDVILLDDRMRAYFIKHPKQAQIFNLWQAEQEFELIDIVEDTSYGRMEIYGKSAP